MQRKIIATSALPYSNGNIHVGHLLEYIQTDIWVRYQRLHGNECHYFCADDTHGTPVMISAKQAGVPPEELIALNQKEHHKDFLLYGIQFTNYSSTNSHHNKQLANDFFKSMEDGGYILSKNIRQAYCETDKMFLPDRFVKGTCPFCKSEDQYGDNCEVCSRTYTADELLNPHCSVCGKPPSKKESEHLFFDLNQHKDFLKDWVKKHTSKEIQNKLLEWFNEDLRAWDISRDAPYFGFEIPNHPGKYFYVWLDAPVGYISSCKEWAEAQGETIADYWQDEKYEVYHFIGKDIIYFHSLFWPAMLRCTKYTSPKHIFAHGFLTVNGNKLSKSRGNAISAKQFASIVPPEYLRYYFAGKITGDVRDIDLNFADLTARINSELIGKIVNLASRSITLLHKTNDGKMCALNEEGKALFNKFASQANNIAASYEEANFTKVVNTLRGLAEQANRYLDANSPWNLAKENPKKASEILSVVINLFRQIIVLLSPVLPQLSAHACKLWGDSEAKWSDIGQPLASNLTLMPYEVLASRIKLEEIEVLTNSSAEKQKK